MWRKLNYAEKTRALVYRAVLRMLELKIGKGRRVTLLQKLEKINDRQNYGHMAIWHGYDPPRVYIYMCVRTHKAAQN